MDLATLILLREESIICCQVNHDIASAARAKGWRVVEINARNSFWGLLTLLYWRIARLLNKPHSFWMARFFSAFVRESLGLRTGSESQIIFFGIGITQPILSIISQSFSHCSVFLMDAWEPLISYAAANLNAHRGNIYLTSKDAADSLMLAAHSQRSLNCQKIAWLPEGINLSIYAHDTPCTSLVRRRIDILEPGRLWLFFHESLRLALVGSNYVHVWQESAAKVLWANRWDYIQALLETRIVVCFPRSLTHPDQAGTFETVTLRYYEAMAAGCLLIGQCPPEAYQIFGYNPVVNLDSGVDLGIQVLDILRNLGDYVDLVERNKKEVIKHTWRKRLDCIEFA